MENCKKITHFHITTDKFSNAGQNLAFYGLSNTFPSSGDVIQNSINDWFNEYANADMSDIRQFSRISNAKYDNSFLI